MNKNTYYNIISDNLWLSKYQCMDAQQYTSCTIFIDRYKNWLWISKMFYNMRPELKHKEPLKYVIFFKNRLGYL